MSSPSRICQSDSLIIWRSGLTRKGNGQSGLTTGIVRISSSAVAKVILHTSYPTLRIFNWNILYKPKIFVFSISMKTFKYSQVMRCSTFGCCCLSNTVWQSSLLAEVEHQILQGLVRSPHLGHNNLDLGYDGKYLQDKLPWPYQVYRLSVHLASRGHILISSDRRDSLLQYTIFSPSHLMNCFLVRRHWRSQSNVDHLTQS